MSFSGENFINEIKIYSEIGFVGLLKLIIWVETSSMVLYRFKSHRLSEFRILQSMGNSPSQYTHERQMALSLHTSTGSE